MCRRLCEMLFGNYFIKLKRTILGYFRELCNILRFLYPVVYLKEALEFNGGSIYLEHISIIKQDIPFIDLPTKVDDEITTYRFFLELSALEPVTYTLLLPSEH